MRQPLITSQWSSELFSRPTIDLPINFSAIFTFPLTRAVFHLSLKSGENLVEAGSGFRASGPLSHEIPVSRSLKTDLQDWSRRSPCMTWGPIVGIRERKLLS